MIRCILINFMIRGSVLSISQNEFGDRIKKGSFTLTDSIQLVLQ